MEIRIPKKELSQNENLSLEPKIITVFDCWEADFNLEIQLHSTILL